MKINILCDTLDKHSIL